MEWKSDAKPISEIERRRAEYVRQALAMAKLSKSSGGDPDIAKLHKEAEKIVEITPQITEEAAEQIEAVEETVPQAEQPLEESVEVAEEIAEEQPEPTAVPEPAEILEELEEIVDADEMLKAMSGEEVPESLESYVESHNRSAENFCRKCGKPK